MGGCGYVHASMQLNNLTVSLSDFNAFSFNIHTVFDKKNSRIYFSIPGFLASIG